MTSAPSPGSYVEDGHVFLIMGIVNVTKDTINIGRMHYWKNKGTKLTPVVLDRLWDIIPC
jgi:hypothetical protein